MSALDIERVRNARPQNEFHYFPSVGSTMTVAALLVADGAPHNTVVVADEQTAGIGRLGRSWISEPSVGVYASILLRLPLPPAQLPVASLLVGLATAEAIQKATQLACDLRWPNDVLIGDRKVAGILPQLVNQCVIAGVGINVNNTVFPATLRTPATSLYLASGGQWQSREVVLIRLLQSLDVFAELLMEEGPDAILRAFTAASSYVVDRRVVTDENGARGVTAGLDEHGFLLLRSEDGQLHRVSSGSVRPIA
ncbi:MAG TPA: biotin--[acetyl-CoA-carboxylase] ligase [Bryobacteraceae bacterium]|jgi:BirA family biotin operon repressor/biotin-[acetyl-CoA-carboxylase] ligase|nr:biotin--[acetyl-CoA-carboxylase] ligase [Bryobacteraceae bacterium]